MFIKEFEYHRPDNLEEACSLLAKLPEAEVLAGGTDLLTDIDTGIRKANHVVSISRIAELTQIQDLGGKIAIGAACTARVVESSPLIQKYFPEIVEMIPLFASPQVRTRATIGGNVCSAVACGDFPVILIALGAKVELVSLNGTRLVQLKDYFLANRKTVRMKGEILTRILIPKKSKTSASHFLKFQRRASNSLAVASVAAFLDIQEAICKEARIVLGAVAPTPIIAKDASKSLLGKKVNGQIISRVAELARKEARPINDVRGSVDFRRQLVYVLTKQAIKQVMLKCLPRKERSDCTGFKC